MQVKVGRVEEAGRLLVRLMRALDVLEGADCHSRGVTRGQAIALVALAPGRCVRMGELAGALGVTPGTATRVLDNLVRDGLARRGVHPKDDRCVCGLLTPRGEAKAKELGQCLQELNREIFGGMTPAQLAGTTRALEAVVSRVEKVRFECCCPRPRRATKQPRRTSHD